MELFCVIFKTFAEKFSLPFSSLYATCGGKGRKRIRFSIDAFLINRETEVDRQKWWERQTEGVKETETDRRKMVGETEIDREKWRERLR